MTKPGKDKTYNSRQGHRRGMGHGGPKMGMPVEKARDFKGTLFRLLGYLRPYKIHLNLVFFTAILSTIFTILSPIIEGKAITKFI